MVIKKQLLIFGILVIIVAGLMIMLSTRQTPQKAEPVVDAETPANDGEFVGITIKVPGVEEDCYWELTVDKMTGLEESGRIFEVAGEYFKNGVVIYTITSEGGNVNLKEQIITFDGKVLLKTSNGRQISADVLLWNTKQEQITATGNVILKSPDSTVTTEKMTTDHQLEKAMFSGMTKVQYQR